MKNPVSRKTRKRIARIAAFGVAAGIIAPGAGNWIGLDAVTSAVFGSVMVLLSLVAAILLTYAGKGEVSDADFDSHINEQIESLKSKSKDK
ncbi:MAG: hypothetical protein ACKOQ8_07745 [Micrococcales bacterium]